MDIKKVISDFLHDFEHNEQKRNIFLMVFIIFIGVSSIFVGFFNTNKNMKLPFIDREGDAVSSIYNTYDDLKKQGKIKDDTSSDTNIDTPVVNNGNQDNSIYSGYPSKSVDTDNDGISDYDEVNAFHTSPFLKDSDGDGISDYDEIQAASDPNCPQGKVCSSVTGTSENSNSDTKSTNNQTLKVNGIDISSLDPAKAKEELRKIIPEDLKPMLDSMTDEQVKTLMKQLYENSAVTNSTLGNPTSGGTTGTTSGVIDYVSALKAKLPQFTPAQISTIKSMEEADIKKLLLDSNIADDNLLSKFKTGELKQLLLAQ